MLLMLNKSMDYLKHYDLLIEKAKSRITLDEYYEKHHIIPKCMGGNNTKNNLVQLSYREHFVCHWLLCKMYPTNFKLKSAFSKMLQSTKNNKRIVNSRQFDIVKRHLKDVYFPWLCKHMEENGPWNKGVTGSQVAWNKGLTIGPHSEESNIKRSLTMKEKFLNTEHHLKGVDPWNKGKTGMQKAWNKGISPDKAGCIHCGLLVSPMNMKRWHDDKCKKKEK